MNEVKRILVIRRDNIGDLVCTTPLLTALRKHYSNARIDVLANSYNAPVLERNPDIDEIYAYSKMKHVSGSGSLMGALAARARLLWELRGREYDLAIVASGPRDFRARRLAKLVGARRVICSDDAVAGQHEVERTFTAARSDGIEGPIPPLQVVPDATEVDCVRQALRNAGAGHQNIVGLHISARRLTQRWPAARFAELSVELHRRFGATTLLLWSPGSENHLQHPGDDAKAAEVQALAKGLERLVPYPTHELRQLIGALASCDIVFCSDGGAMHVAAGLGKPIACLFGDSSISRWRPWGTRHIVLHSSGGNVERVSTAEAIQAVTELFA